MAKEVTRPSWAELGCDKTTALKVISELNLFNWTDKFTSAVIAKFTVFNFQVNCSVWFGSLLRFHQVVSWPLIT